jgi:hypothetical protein
MPRNPAFELFEAICQELTARETTIIPEDDVSPALIEDLKDHYGETADRTAFERALAELTEHFAGKGSKLPFEFDGATGEFRAADTDYIAFVAFAANKRGLGGTDAKDFEVRTVERLAKRLTGALHRVGTPRTQHNKKKDFVRYLKALGFDDDCLEPRDKDGGLDILWLPPLGSVPLRPVVSVQCKNASFNADEANASVGRAHTTLQRHSHIRGHNSLYFVVFNDYIDKTYIGRARGWAFIPLGLSDLGVAQQVLEKHLL